VTGSRNVVVAVLDESIQIAHPDLAANVWKNPGEVAGDGIDNDANGYVDDVNGWDFYYNDNTVYDAGEDAHGTHVAGAIGAVGGNGTGVAGVNWNVGLEGLFSGVTPPPPTSTYDATPVSMSAPVTVTVNRNSNVSITVANLGNTGTDVSVALTATGGTPGPSTKVFVPAGGKVTTVIGWKAPKTRGT
jgi:hypothetical protein